MMSGLPKLVTFQARFEKSLHAFIRELSLAFLILLHKFLYYHSNQNNSHPMKKLKPKAEEA